jgi:periplasmic copper chaperone A
METTMKRLLPLVALTLLGACSTLGLPEVKDGPLSAFDAAEPTSSSASTPLAFNDAWASITPNGTTVAAGYLTLANTGEADDRLISATTPRATRVDVHEMSLAGKTMKMRTVQRGVVVPAGGEVAFKQGGLHLMFTGVDAPFVEGETIPVKLVFQKAGEVDVSLRVSDQPTLSVADAWIGITPQGATVAAGYLTVANTGVAGDKLISAESPRAGRIELHEMSKNGRTMKMRPVKSGITVPAGAAVLLEKGGFHLMFMDIDAPFADGETVPVTLTFEKAGTVDLKLDVKPPVVAQH